MPGHNASPGAMLANFLESIERLEEQKRQIAEAIRDKKAEARKAGFDTKAMNQMLRERRMDQAERSEFQAICETYRAALGMLGGTPLGDYARRRLAGQAEPEAPETAATPDSPPADTEAAREAGRQAAREGKRVIDNPFVAGDPRRAAWDEGWCAQSGTDGMEIPEAWRRKPKKKPEPEGEAEGEGQQPAPEEPAETGKNPEESEGKGGDREGK